MSIRDLAIISCEIHDPLTSDESMRESIPEKESEPIYFSWVYSGE
jgi:hypothetical protein